MTKFEEDFDFNYTDISLANRDLIDLYRECQNWRRAFVYEYSKEKKLTESEMCYLQDELLTLKCLPKEFVWYPQYANTILEKFKVEKILKKFSYSQILEKMGDQV